MSFAPGTLAKTRGREWVVLPESDGKVVDYQWRASFTCSKSIRVQP